MTINTSAMDVRINITSIHLDCTAMKTQHLTQYLCKIQKCITATIITSIALPSIALSCSCAPNTNKLQFVSANYLPANAKGVLLLREPAEAFKQIPLNQETMLVADYPRPIAVKSILIQDQTSGKAITARIRKLELPIELSNSWVHQFKPRYLKFKQAIPTQCFTNWNNEEDIACEILHDLKKSPEEITKHLQQGDLVDVSLAMKQSYGLFRVEPKTSFIPDHSYEFRLNLELFNFYQNGDLGKKALAKLDHEKIQQLSSEHDEYHNTRPLVVKIGPAVQLPTKIDYQLEKVGEVQGKSISVPAGGRCEMQAYTRLQELAFVIPANYQAYYNSLQYFWQKKQNNDKFDFFVYKSSLCTPVSFNRSELPRGKEMIYQYDFYQSKNFTVRGYAGFLELDDQLHLTPEIEVSLQTPTSSEQSDKK